jgi:thioesterase-3
LSVDIIVRGYHLDIYQHVNNGRYLEFLEESRWDFLGHHRLVEQFQERDLAIVVANININYRKPAVFGDVLRVSTSVAAIGNKSAKFSQAVWRLENGEPKDLVVDAVVTFCFLDDASQNAVVISGDVRAILESLLEIGE